jgi:L(+)-tartrate dehydratase beta subunit
MTEMSTSELPMDEHRLKTPVTPDALAKVKLGDVVYIDGTVFTGRIGLYKKLFDEGAEPPANISALTNVTFHCSPAVGETSPGEWKVSAVTATASFRFEKHLPMLMDEYGVRVVIGKGGMSPEVYENHFKRLGAVFLNTVGYGIGAQYGRGVQKVDAVHWLDELGIAQAMWVLNVKRFGPFLVECDTQGRSLYQMALTETNEELKQLYEGLPLPALKRMGEIHNPEDEVF